MDEQILLHLPSAAVARGMEINWFSLELSVLSNPRRR